ncbi:hypothetical protein-transmembrane prediction [Rhodopirellula baltica SH 1]|uniref:Uncharacterized protein n=1 Tax=Rhodopirellula baltica (strain DSM 10527 / NCIMB 13988 / SH1) TaxID=243090 RepID=Q7UT07_RHOBA|nr:hypothetical protein-transmembrane prediction [Rhodopirellula baltica SH 1]
MAIVLVASLVANILCDTLSIGRQQKRDKVNGLLFCHSLAIIFGDFEKPQVEAIKSSPQNTVFLKSLTLRSRSQISVELTIRLRLSVGIGVDDTWLEHDCQIITQLWGATHPWLQ